MFKVGFNLSTSKDYTNMGSVGLKVSANLFKFFLETKRFQDENIRRRRYKDLIDLARENIFGPLFAHALYALNPFSSAQSARKFVNLVLADDL